MSHSNGIGNLQNLLGSVDVTSTRQISGAASRTESGTVQPRAASALNGRDQAVLSPAGNAVAQALTGSDVRTEKVSALKAAIDSGSYKVPAGQVAEKLIQSLLN